MVKISETFEDWLNSVDESSETKYKVQESISTEEIGCLLEKFGFEENGSLISGSADFKVDGIFFRELFGLNQFNVLIQDLTKYLEENREVNDLYSSNKLLCDKHEVLGDVINIFRNHVSLEQAIHSIKNHNRLLFEIVDNKLKRVNYHSESDDKFLTILYPLQKKG
jgi:hypothetical protein